MVDHAHHDGPVAPTVPDITTELRQLQQDAGWVAQKKKDEKHEGMYYNDESYKVDSLANTSKMLVNPGLHIVKQGGARELVDQLTGLMLVYPRHSVDSPGITPSKEEHAEKIEDFSNILPQLLETQQGEDTNALITAEVNLIGYTARVIVPDLLGKWGDRPKRDQYDEGPEGDAAHTKGLDEYHQTAPVPILDEHISATGWYPVLDGRTVIRSYEVTKVTRAQAKARYGYDQSIDGDTSTSAGDKQNEEIELVRYIDDTWCAVLATEDKGEWVVKPWRHYMPVQKGHAPVVLYEGVLTPSRKPGKRWTSAIETLYDIFKAIDYTLSRQKLQIATWHGSTIIEQTKKDVVVDVLAQTKNEVDDKFLLNAANSIADNRAISVLEPPKTLPDAEAFYGKLRKIVDDAFPEVLKGVIPGETSGYLFNLAQELASARFTPVSARLARSDAESAGLRLLAIIAVEEALGQTTGDAKVPGVAVRRRTDKGTEPIVLTADDVRDYPQLIECTRDAERPVDKLANLDAALKAWKEMELPKAYALREYMGVENPAELEIEYRAEQLMASDAMRARTDEEILVRLQVIVDKEDGMSKEDAGQRRLPGGLRRALGLEQPGVPPAARGAPGGAEAILAAEGDVTAPPPPPPPNAARGGGGGGGRAGFRARPGGPRRQAGSPTVRGESR